MKHTAITLFVMAAFAAAPLAAEDTHGCKKPETRTEREIFSVECECNVAQYTCDECRYELGLVKLDPSLVRSPGEAGGLIKVLLVTKQNAQALLPLHGEIVLVDTNLTHVSARVGGTVRTIKTALGKPVNKGDVLFEIESPELGLAIGAYRKNMALAALARKHFEREKALVSQQLSPEADLVDAQMKYDEYRVELESAGNALASMGLDAKTIDALTADKESGKPSVLPVHAPQSGTVIEQHLSLGETIERGKDVLTVADLSSVWAWLEVYENDLPALTSDAKTGALRVRVAVASLPERTFESTIDLIGATMDKDTRTVKIRALLDNAEGLLRPGMFCAANIVFETQEKVIAVAKNALMSDEGKHFVFRMVRDGFALRTDVEIGRDFDDSVEITCGLMEGMQIVTEGAFVLKSDILRAKMGAGCAD